MSELVRKQRAFNSALADCVNALQEIPELVGAVEDFCQRIGLDFEFLAEGKCDGGRVAQAIALSKAVEGNDDGGSDPVGPPDASEGEAAPV